MAQDFAKFLSVSDVAKRLRVEPTAVKGWCDSGVLPCFDLSKFDASRKNRCYRVDPDELDKWLDARRVEKPEPRRKSTKKGRYDNV